MRPMRVAMISMGYIPLLGGAERMLATIVPLLQAQQVDVQIVTRRHPGLSSFEIIDGVPVHRLPIPGPKPTASLAFTLTAMPLLRRLKPDIIHAHEVFSPTTTAVTAKRMLGMPVVVTAHRSGPIGDVERLKQKLFGMRRLATFRTHVDAFIAISQEIDAEFAAVGIPPKQRYFLPNGVDTVRFAPLDAVDKQQLRAKLGLPDVPIVVYSGRLVPEKRVQQLVDMWPAIRTVHSDALLLLLGSGPEEGALKRAAGAGVQFAGKIDDVVPYLQAADIFVLPSVAEGLSVALLEAMACGLPAVVTAVGGAPDVITHGENGLLVPPDQPAALQAALLKLLQEVQYRTSLGQRGRERVVREYDLSSIVGRLKHLYEQLLNKPFTTHVPSNEIGNQEAE